LSTATICNLYALDVKIQDYATLCNLVDVGVEDLLLEPA